ENSEGGGAGGLVERGGEDPDRSRRDHVSECEHHRGEKDRDQHHRFEHPSARQIGSYEQKGEDAAERHRDQRHPHRDQSSRSKGPVEVRIGKDKRKRRGRGLRRGLEKRRTQNALVENDPQRQQHRRRRDQDDQYAVQTKSAHRANASRALLAIASGTRAVWTGPGTPTTRRSLGSA